MKKIGIMGGTFDPIHNGHISIAERVGKNLKLDRVLLIPSNIPPHKTRQKVLPAKHRFAMVRLAVKGRPLLAVSPLEIRRGGKSYTLDTLRALEKRFSRSTEFFLILGVDAFLDFLDWRKPAVIIKKTNIVVVSRPGFRFSRFRGHPYLKNRGFFPLTALDKGSRRRCDLALPSGRRLIFLRVPSKAVSATQIRGRRGQKRLFKKLLPPPVESYIIKNSLYQ